MVVISLVKGLSIKPLGAGTSCSFVSFPYIAAAKLDVMAS